MFVIAYKKWTADKQKKKKVFALLVLCWVFTVVLNLTRRPIISGTHGTIKNNPYPHRLLSEQTRL